MRAEIQGTEENFKQNPTPFSPKKRISELITFILLSACCSQLISQWTTFSFYLQFLDAFDTDSRIFSGFVGAVFTLSIFALYLPFPSERFPRSFLAIALFCNATASGILLGIHATALSLGTFGAVLFGGFIGFIASIPLVIFLGIGFDEVDSFPTFIQVTFAILGMLIFAGILGELMTRYPQTFGALQNFVGLWTLLLGGLLGYGFSSLLTFFLEEEGVSYIFKMLLFAFFSGQSAQIAYQAFQHLCQ